MIVFDRVVDPNTGDTAIFAVNPDGTNMHELLSPGNLPRWSPDGTEISVQCCDIPAVILNPDTGVSRQFQNPNPTLFNEDFFCPSWSPDGTLLACIVQSDPDPSLNGIYTIRSADGGGLARITFGNDGPGDFSPHGGRLVFNRSHPNGSVSLDVVTLSSGHVRQITPPGMIVEPGNGGSSGNWSPTGNEILFVSRTDPNHARAIWVVHADGSGLREIPILPACGGVLVRPCVRILPRSRLVPGRDEDRLRSLQRKHWTSEHLHRQRRREWPLPGNERRTR